MIFINLGHRFFNYLCNDWQLYWPSRFSFILQREARAEKKFLYDVGITFKGYHSTVLQNRVPKNVLNSSLQSVGFTLFSLDTAMALLFTLNIVWSYLKSKAYSGYLSLKMLLPGHRLGVINGIVKFLTLSFTFQRLTIIKTVA